MKGPLKRPWKLERLGRMKGWKKCHGLDFLGIMNVRNQDCFMFDDSACMHRVKSQKDWGL
jgi:hypothetical protein